MIHPALGHYLTVAAVLFGLGLFTAVTRRNVIGMLLGVELILNAAILNFIAFDHFVAEGTGGKGTGQVFALIAITFAASQAAIALAIVLYAYRTHRTVAADELTELRH
jgi:NADH-quinone oxidoreductase subunit K